MKEGTIYGALKDRPEWLGGRFNKVDFKIVLSEDGSKTEAQRMGSSTPLDLTTSLPSVSQNAANFIIMTGKRLIAGAMSDKAHVVDLIKRKLGEECDLSEGGVYVVYYRIETTRRDIDVACGIQEKIINPNN